MTFRNAFHEPKFDRVIMVLFSYSKCQNVYLLSMHKLEKY